MEKKFFETFPNLKLEGVLHDLCEQTVVEKITATRRKDLLRIYIRSARLIEKEHVYRVEHEIKKQFFSQDNITIKIYERFVLSGQYTPEKLMDLYKESILLELKACEHMLYTMFCQADMNFLDEGTMELILEDGVIAKSKEDALVGILDKVLNERCGFRVKFLVSYKEAKTGKYKEDDEIRIQKIVEHITSRIGAADAGAEHESEPVLTPKVNNKGAAAEKKETSSPSFSVEKKGFQRADSGKDRGFQRRALKRSDNPNVIFGRDFEDETINIEEIWGEMGEVAIRGKVRVLDKREIRN